MKYKTTEINAMLSWNLGSKLLLLQKYWFKWHIARYMLLGHFTKVQCGHTKYTVTIIVIVGYRTLKETFSIEIYRAMLYPEASICNISWHQLIATHSTAQDNGYIMLAWFKSNQKPIYTATVCPKVLYTAWFVGRLEYSWRHVPKLALIMKIFH